MALRQQPLTAASPSSPMMGTRNALPQTADYFAAGAGRSLEPGASELDRLAHATKVAMAGRTIDQVYADVTAARARRRQQQLQQESPVDANELQVTVSTASLTASGDVGPRSGGLDSGPISTTFPATAVMAARRRHMSSASAGMTDLQVWAQLVHAVTGGRALDIVIADMKSARAGRAAVSRNSSKSSLLSARMPRLAAAAPQSASRLDPEDGAAAVALRRSLDDGLTPAEAASTVTVMDERLMRTMSVCE